jgi:plastocyanin
MKSNMLSRRHAFFKIKHKLSATGGITLSLLLACATASSSALAQSRALLTVRDGRGAPVEGAVVMLQASSGTSLASRLVRRDFSVGQLDREFVPKVSIAAVGSRVTFPNRDTVQHSVYSFSKAKSFEIPIYAGESPQVITLDKAGVIAIGCNIHDWMAAYIVVADAPIAELTKADGTVTVSDLPRGKYTARVWHPQLKNSEATQEFTMLDAESRVELKLELAPTRTRYKPPLNLKQY